MLFLVNEEGMNREVLQVQLEDECQRIMFEGNEESNEETLMLNIPGGFLGEGRTKQPLNDTTNLIETGTEFEAAGFSFT